MEIIFSGGVYVGENTSRLANVRIVRLRRTMRALPRGTNTAKPALRGVSPEDRYLAARNKWLLAHPESAEAKNGAAVALRGENIDIAPAL